MFRTVAVATVVAVCSLALAGPLSPPAGPVSPTMKPLDAIEPRVCVNDMPGDEGAVVIIDQPGRYYLRADVVGTPGQHGIRVTAQGDVCIDLNGFNLTGVPGSLNGIDMDFQLGVPNTRLQVRCPDGACRSSISDWGGDGVRTSGVPICECTHLLVEHNGGNGITHLHAEGVIHRDVATRNCVGDGTHVTPPVQAAAGRGVTNRYMACRARSNGGNGWNIDARADSYQIAFDDCYACGNVGDGVRINEDATIPGGGGGAGKVKFERLSVRDSGGDGVHVSIPCASPTVVSASAVSCVGNLGDGMEIDAVGTAVPHFGATCMIQGCEFSSNGANGLRSENPMFKENSTCGENVLYGLSVSGPDTGTQMVCGDTNHLVSNGSGGAQCGPGRFSGGYLSVSDNGGPGITVTDGCLILNNSSVTNNDGNGVTVTDGTLNIVSGNFRRNSGWGGVCGGTGAVCVMDDAVFELNGAGVANTGGMNFDNCPSVTLRRCVFNDNTGAGVRCRSSVGPVKWMSPEMILQGNSGNGADLDNITGGTLDRCASSGNGGIGMLLGASCTKVRVTGCSSTDDGGGGIWVTGTGNMIVGCSATANAVGAFDIAPNNTAGLIISGGELPQSRDCNANVVW